MYRIGTGFDAHAFCEGRKLVLGGVSIPSVRGLDGHSDADVLSHAVADAVLGAIGEGDIGRHFPLGQSAIPGDLQSSNPLSRGANDERERI